MRKFDVSTIDGENRKCLSTNVQYCFSIGVLCAIRVVTQVLRPRCVTEGCCGNDMYIYQGEKCNMSEIVNC